MKAAQTYLDIVYSQFKKSKINIFALCGAALIWAIAIFAPLIASSYPLIYIEKGEQGTSVSSPWLESLFYTNGEEVLQFLDVTTERVIQNEKVLYTYSFFEIHPDLLFNMLMLAAIPTIIYWVIFVRKRQTSAVHKWARVLIVYFTIGILFTVLGSIKPLKPKFNTRFDHTEYVLKSQVAECEEKNLNRDKVTAIFTLVPFGPYQIDMEFEYQKPLSRKSDMEGFVPRRTNDWSYHLLGTTGNGYDLFTRLLYGTRISITVGIVAVFIYSSIGTVIGAIAGYFGGKPDLIISRIIEIIIMIPSLFLIAILVGLTERSVYIVMLAIGVIGWTGVARLIRGEFLRQRSIDFVTAAQALGASKFRLIFRHILPNAIHPLLVAIPFGIAASAATEGALSFIGYGVRPPTASWGIILEEARRNLDTLGEKWWLIIFPSLAIFATVALFNLVGNGIRDAVDPRLRGTQ